MSEGDVLPKFWAEAPAPRPFDDSGLHVHRYEGVTGHSLVVFVHGWGGSGYTTWGELPNQIYDDPTLPADVALFDYVSGARRRVNNNPDLETVAEELQTQVESTPYERIVFVCHSMGGVVASAALRLSLESVSSRTRQPLAHRTIGIVFLASPRAGVRPLIFGRSKDARFLRSQNDVVARNDRFFTNRVDPHLERSAPTKLWIPLWAGRATSDAIVTHFSSAYGIPSDQSVPFRGDHRSFLHKQDLRDWVLKACRSSLLHVVQAPPDSATPAIRTQFRGHPEHSHWEDAYHEAVTKFQEKSKGIVVFDATHGQRRGEPLDLRVRVIPADLFDVRDYAVDFERYAQELASGLLHTLGVVPFGGLGLAVASEVAAQFVEIPAWVSPADTSENLEELIVLWLERTKRSLIFAHRLSRVDTGDVS
ncbi:alpha/beta fold hydrolase [Nocardioides nanhaiensis]|uniref:AB hydrolase-1 domain-containing protein n=1 Tax=Nocardioides nanhaiensis TaxID=1476871 RepID=A0ABP8VUT4_9ACTN